MLLRKLLRIVPLLVFALSPARAQRDDPAPDEPSYSEEETPPLSPDPHVKNEVKTLLKNEGYRFCTDADYRLFEAEKSDICPKLSSLEGRCPQLAAACSRPSWEADLTLDTDESWFDWSLLSFDSSKLAALFKLIFWTALGIGAFLLLRALVRQAKQWREERTLEQKYAPSVLIETSDNGSEELRAQVLLQMAKAELERNNVTESLHLTYRATIRALCDAEWVKPHRSKTSGDYLRHLRRIESADATLPVSEVKVHLLELDRERFRTAPRQESARGLLEQATQLSLRLTQVGAVLLGFLALGCDLSNVPEPPHQPMAPRGGQLFEDLMRSRTGSVTRRMERVTEVPEGTTSVVSMNAPLRKLEWNTLEDWTSRGGHLVVAAPNPEFSSVFDLRVATEECSEPLLAPNLSLETFGGTRRLPGDPGSVTLARCGKLPFAQSQAYGDGWLTIIADASFFDNIHLAASDNATLALHLIGYLGEKVEYLGPFTGQGAQHPLQSVARAGFSFWVMHVLLLGLIYAWSQGKRFGTPLDPPEEKRRAFSEHARALSLKYEQSGASGWALRSYAEWVLDTLRRRTPSTRSDLKSLTRAVSSSPEEAARLLQTITTARRADELGETTKEHISTFLKLKSAVLGISEVSRRSRNNKE